MNILNAYPLVKHTSCLFIKFCNFFFVGYQCIILPHYALVKLKCKGVCMRMLNYYIIHTVEEDNIQDLPYLVDRLPVHDHRLVAHQRDMGHFLCILHSDKDGPQEIL